MSLTPPSGGRLFVEPLEARIAPTGLTGLANNTAFANDQNYVAYNGAAPVDGQRLGFVPGEQFGIHGADVYALVLSGGLGTTPGDKLLIFNQQTGFNDTNPFLQVNTGHAIAFFQDKNHDGQVQTNELVGLSLGKKSSVGVQGSVDGDVVTNLSKTGTLMLDSVGKPGFTINGLNITGNVTGKILSGGNMNNVQVGGTIQGALAGTATNGATFNFTGTAGAVSGTITTGAYKDLKPGASIVNLTILALPAQGVIQAGDGGLGAAGGGVNNLIVLGDTDAFSVLGGTGGPGNDALLGGVGGTVDTVRIAGVSNSVANHVILIQAGNGGADAALKGGAGGMVTGVFTSFEVTDPANNTGGTPSASLLAQNLIVHAGDGGDGLKGGVGGDVTNSALFGAIPDDGNVANAEVQVYAGHGGHNLNDNVGKGGKGGVVNLVRVENLDTLAEANASSILIQAGDAATGKRGGNVDSLTLLGKNITVNAGNGADSSGKGGDGGDLNTINVLNLTNLFASQLTLNAGQGGNAGGGNGGNGGNILNVQMLDSDLTALSINTGTHGNGGSSQGALGGTGGSLTNVNLADSNPSGIPFISTNPTVNGTPAVASVRSGLGGDGENGGGLGGDVNGFTLQGTGFRFNLTAGAGGAGGATDGGAGGNLTNVSISNVPDISNLTTSVVGLTGTLTAGAGGAGSSAGGAGGVLDTVTLSVGDTITLQAGNGGTGGGGASGAGGSVSATNADSLVGGVSLNAGDAGLQGATPGDGGSITGFVSTAGLGISIRAGNGHAGGAGGSISFSGTSLNLLTGLPNLGALTVRAGNGDTGNNVAGAGGSIDTFDGVIGLNAATTISAGNGGGSADARKVGAGGSISGLSLIGSGIAQNPTTAPETAQQVYVDAGSAGISNLAKRGAAGGSVDSVTIHELDANTLVHHIAAGDASSGVNRGADGGSISHVYAGTAGDSADIGVRTGVAFGYAGNQSGGLFAGVGGTGAKSSGVNGSVVDVTAGAISGIVAGGKTGQRIQLTETVDQIYLEGVVSTRANSDGSFANIGTANFVGSVVNPNVAGASIYKAGDGLIASRNLTENRNFVTPEAQLRLDANGNIVFVDYEQPLDAPVTFPSIPANLV